MDTPWAAMHRSRLRLTIVTVTTTLLLLYVGIRMYEPPSCVDNKMNQEEKGVDCGGPCERYCAFQAQETRTAWVQAIEVSEGWWSALAYLENPNFDKQVRYAPYRLALYDSAGELILAREGRTFINQEPIVPIFEGRLNVAGRKPQRATFEWLQELDWYVVDKKYQIEMEERKLTSNGLGHDLAVTLSNRGPETLYDVEVVAILYDTEDTVVAISQTYIDMLHGRGKQTVNFSWPRPFAGEVGRIEVIPRVPEQVS